MGLAAFAVVEKVAAMMEYRMKLVASSDDRPRFLGTGFDVKPGGMTTIPYYQRQAISALLVGLRGVDTRLNLDMDEARRGPVS